MPGVEMVAPFGTLLHVSGTDAAALGASIAALTVRPGVRARKVAPGLEDVFIHLMGAARHGERAVEAAR